MWEQILNECLQVIGDVEVALSQALPGNKLSGWSEYIFRGPKANNIDRPSCLCGLTCPRVCERLANASFTARSHESCSSVDFCAQSKISPCGEISSDRDSEAGGRFDQKVFWRGYKYRS